MTKTKKINITIMLLSFILLLSFGLFGIVLAKADEGDFKIKEEIKSQYNLGTEFDVPYATFTKDGVEFDLQHVLTYPDGKQSFNTGNIFDVMGEYSLIYFSSDESIGFLKEYKFNVVVEDVTSLFVNIEGCSFEKKVTVDKSWCDFDFTGMAVHVSRSGGSFMYKYPIDLTKSDSLSNFIELIPAVYRKSHRDTKSMTLRLTDVNDQNNYIEIFTTTDSINGGSGAETYIGGTANGLYESKGYYFRDSLTTPIIVRPGKALKWSFEGKPREDALTNKVGFSYVANEKQLYAQAMPEDLNPTLIWDYDEPEYIEESALFRGFSENRAYLTVSISTYDRDPPRIVILSINGNDLSGASVDSKSLDISVDTLGYDINALPKGVVGYNYPVFNAISYDNIGVEYNNVTTRVISPNGENLSILNGQVKTDVAGTYKIVYTATGSYFDAIKTVEFNVVDNPPKLSYEISDKIETNVQINDCVYIYDGRVIGNDNDAFGKTTVSYRVYNKYGDVKIENFGLGNFFKATTNGDYYISYSVKDLLGREDEVTEKITVTNPLMPKLDTPVIPRVMIIGRTYNLPIVNALQYIDGGSVYVPVKVFIDDVEITNEMVFKPKNIGEYVIKYQAKSLYDESVAEYQQKVTVNDPENPEGLFFAEYLSLENLVATYGGEKKYNDEKFRLSVVDTSKQTASVEFSQLVPDKALSVEFMVEGGKIIDGEQVIEPKNNFDKIKVTFKDSVNFEERIEIVLYPYNDSIGVIVNGVYCGLIEGSFYGTSQKNIKISYDYVSNSLVDASGNVITKLNCNYNGEKFSGFSSTNTYVELEFIGINGESEIKSLSIGNLIFSQLTRDIFPPVFVFTNYQTQVDYLPVGTTYTVEKIFTYDTLGAPVTNLLRITDPKKDTIYTGSIDKPFDLVLDKVGTYVFSYNASDGNMQNTKSITIYVYEEEKPIIEPVQIVTEVNVGQSFNLPEIKAEDNYDSADKLKTYIYVINQYGRQYFISPGEVKLETAGRYIIRYVAIDSSNNLAYLDYALIVK